jgi:hypothetical protein
MPPSGHRLIATNGAVLPAVFLPDAPRCELDQNPHQHLTRDDLKISWQQLSHRHLRPGVGEICGRPCPICTPSLPWGSVANPLLDRTHTRRELSDMCACRLDRYIAQNAEEFTVVVLAIRVPVDKRNDSVPYPPRSADQGWLGQRVRVRVSSFSCS